MLNAARREVRLYGVLGRKFGRVWHLAVGSAQEAVAALSAVVPGFKAHLVAHSEPGYRVFVGAPGGVSLAEEQLPNPVGAREAICIVPVVVGAKRAGVGQIIAGIVLIAAGFAWGYFTGDYSGASSMMVKGGVYLGLGGVLTVLFAPRPTKRDERLNQASYGFDGPANTDEEGLPVPVNYGRVITGGARISSGISTDELPIPSPLTTLDPAELPFEQPQDPFYYDFDSQGGSGG